MLVAAAYVEVSETDVLSIVSGIGQVLLSVLRAV